MAFLDIKAAVDSPAQGTFQSSAGQSQSLNLNPAFLFGAGNLTSSPSGSPGADVSPSSQSSTPTNVSVPFSSGVGIGALPSGAVPGGTIVQAASPISGSLLVWLLIGGALILVLGSGGKR